MQFMIFLIKYRYKAIFYKKKSITSFITVCFAAITLKSIVIVTPASHYVTHCHDLVVDLKESEYGQE